jgi:hypothetical protein
MELLLDKPAGTIIQEREGAEGITLYWTPPSPKLVRYAIAAFLGFFLCCWAAAGIFPLVQVVAGEPEVEGGGSVFLVVWLAFWALGGLMVGWTFWPLVRPARPEAVTLGAGTFRHDPGASPALWMMWPGWTCWYHFERPRSYFDLFRRRNPILVPRSELNGFVLARVGERQRITFDRGADRIEIGADLREPEREWLHAVLERWRLG